MESDHKINQPPFSLKVDAENKATEFRPLSISAPHMRAFHLAWLSLFSCFVTTFSIPPLTPVIRDDLKLTDTDIGNAGSASFLGAIFSRLAMGPVCDIVGPRISSATLSFVTAAIILCTSLVTSPNAFILIRFLVGFCLANFIANQFWMSCMFSGCVIGVANGVSAGWASMGSALAQLLMPQIYAVIRSYNVPSSTAWRVSFIIPATFQTITAVMVLAYGQDLPSGNYKQSQRADENKRGKFLEVLLNGLTNFRGWILALAYAYSFGSELTTNNIIAQYFYDRFGVNLQVAGMIAASFALTNCFAKPMGGMLSDELAARFGVRGRLWGLWVVQTIAGLLCLLLGRVNSLWGSIAVMCLFSVFIQAATGLMFGVVPFVSKR